MTATTPCPSCGAPSDAAPDGIPAELSCSACLGALLTRASAALDASTTRVGGAFPRKSATLPAGPYTAATFALGGESWAACRGQQDSSAARLLDAAVAHRMFVGARYAVAMLQAPSGGSKHDPGKEEFLRAYQAAAFHGCGVVFLREPFGPAAPAWQPPALPRDHRRFLDVLAGDVREALAVNGAIPGDFLHASSDAECIVRPLVHAILRKRGYDRAEATYASFWRRAATDGSWTIDGGDGPRRIALEVKLAEDVDWPLCQPVEALAAHDAVLQVRLVTPGVGKSLAGLSPAAREALATLVSKLPLRSVEFLSAL